MFLWLFNASEIGSVQLGPQVRHEVSQGMDRNAILRSHSISSHLINIPFFTTYIYSTLYIIVISYSVIVILWCSLSYRSSGSSARPSPRYPWLSTLARGHQMGKRIVGSTLQTLVHPQVFTPMALVSLQKTHRNRATETETNEKEKCWISYLQPIKCSLEAISTAKFSEEVVACTYHGMPQHQFTTVWPANR